MILVTQYDWYMKYGYNCINFAICLCSEIGYNVC
ncbi:uncharacterized protein METZ01_LOCUS100313 [marine metagenome]|uniref:Uncharacterized protein n=1 Tax=marine metagenome TaxID=408172 RepID=A0A381W4H9_9ZZZZ